MKYMNLKKEAVIGIWVVFKTVRKEWDNFRIDPTLLFRMLKT